MFLWRPLSRIAVIIDIVSNSLVVMHVLMRACLLSLGARSESVRSHPSSREDNNVLMKMARLLRAYKFKQDDRMSLHVLVDGGEANSFSLDVPRSTNVLVIASYFSATLS